MASHPSSDFYWADWENDPLVKAVSLAAQGLWMRICCRCHHSPERGYLLNEDGSVFTLEELAGQVGKSPEEIAPLIEELKARKVCDVDEFTGAIINRRMAVKEPLRKARAYVNGKRGGNPALKGKKPIDPLMQEMRDAIRRDQAKERQRRYRERKAEQSETSNADVTPSLRVTSRAVTRNNAAVTHNEKRDAKKEATEMKEEFSAVTQVNPLGARPPSSFPLHPSLSEKAERCTSASLTEQAPPPSPLIGGGGALEAQRQGDGKPSDSKRAIASAFSAGAFAQRDRSEAIESEGEGATP